METTQIYKTEIIKEAMDAQNLSVQDVAELSGISRPTIYEVLKGKPTVSVETLTVVAASLKIPLNNLFNEPATAQMPAAA